MPPRCLEDDVFFKDGEKEITNWAGTKTPWTLNREIGKPCEKGSIKPHGGERVEVRGRVSIKGYRKKALPAAELKLPYLNGWRLRKDKVEEVKRGEGGGGTGGTKRRTYAGSLTLSEIRRFVTFSYLI